VPKKEGKEKSDEWRKEEKSRGKRRRIRAPKCKQNLVKNGKNLWRFVRCYFNTAFVQSNGIGLCFICLNDLLLSILCDLTFRLLLNS
jgi:hypothetical protein